MINPELKAFRDKVSRATAPTPVSLSLPKKDVKCDCRPLKLKQTKDGFICKTCNQPM